MSHSEEAMNENPMNIPKVPPAFPTRDINELIKYSFLTILIGSWDLTEMEHEWHDNFFHIQFLDKNSYQFLVGKTFFHQALEA